MKINKFNIVIYGCDNTGKTTLAKAIERKFKEVVGEAVSVLYTKSLGPATFSEQLNFLSEHCTNQITKGCESNLQVEIFDRFPIIEEYVCGNIFRGKDNFEAVGQDYVNNELFFINMFIHCNPPLERVIKWGDREQMDGVKENAQSLYFMYDTVKYHFPKMKNRAVTFDYTQQDLEEFANSIVLEVTNFFISQNTVERYGSL